MQHLAIIPDGNRRWAKANKLESIFGHRKGLDAVRAAITVCIKNKIQYLSIYTFSLENFNRPEQEKSYLFNMITDLFAQQLPQLLEQGVRVRFCGDSSQFPSVTRESIRKLQEATAQCSTLTLNLLFCYGGRREIVAVTQELARRVASGSLRPDQIDEAAITKLLWTGDAPDPELIIRTGNVARLSNFLLFQSAYSELMFVPEFWPEMTEEKLQECLQRFETIQRNFGK